MKGAPVGLRITLRAKWYIMLCSIFAEHLSQRHASSGRGRPGLAAAARPCHGLPHLLHKAPVGLHAQRSTAQRGTGAGAQALKARMLLACHGAPGAGAAAAGHAGTHRAAAAARSDTTCNPLQELNCSGSCTARTACPHLQRPRLHGPVLVQVEGYHIGKGEALQEAEARQSGPGGCGAGGPALCQRGAAAPFALLRHAAHCCT